MISLLSKGFSRVLQHHSSKASIIWCSPILQCSSILQLDLEKAEKTEINMPTSTGSQKKQESSRKNIYFCFIDYTKAFVWITTNWKILQQMGIPDHLTCLLTNLYVGQEATVRTGLLPNQERSISRLYIVTLLIQLMCGVHHAKCQAG